MKTNVIEVHYTCTAGNRAKANSNGIDITKIHTLVGKGLQIDIPFGPGGYPVIMQQQLLKILYFCRPQLKML